MTKISKIYVAGHNGLVGSAIVRKLKNSGYKNIVTRSSAELDLRNQFQVEEFFEKEKPEYVFLAAAKVGGIKANMEYPAQFIYDNLTIETNVIHAAYKHGVKKLLFLGSSCIYPRDCKQPIKEGYLLTSPLEKSNEFYAIAKIAGLKLCQAYNRQYGTNFISCMPTNLYGPNDNYDLETSHVMAAMIAKFTNAKRTGSKQVILWGTGNPLREFLHVDDLADACLFLMQHYNSDLPINVGTGKDITIKDLANLIAEKIGYSGEIIFDNSVTDGTPRKLLDVTEIDKLGWKFNIKLEKGIKKVSKLYFEERR
ncbi:GDP-fucose synthetase [candidate division TM6 bacterium RIFCSPHIGHO2_12_FULL_32_22]|nr:MAG: GDP-fucose synthetase [candidate division TM6 bacterium RIFCSPHIGHO2_12_FULL_32_22]